MKLYFREPVFRETRESLMKRTGGWKCERCSSEKHIQIHHIKPVKNGGNNDLSNLLLLCQKCHKKEHYGWSE